ncbi:uncharacterized protein TNCV_1029361 [Trichonephila clavipes]|nr:uncharacterized protein TNCV_1029361 [Trichonephila clavipes]
MFDLSPFANPTPLAHADTSRDVLPRGGTSQLVTELYGWVSSYVLLPGNERADQKAKQGAKLPQLEVPLTLRSAKSITSTYIDKYAAVTQQNKAFGKPWESVAPVGPILRHLETAETVACFRLTIGLDFLGIYLHWLHLATDEACQIYDHTRMDGDHLLQFK